MNRRRSFFFAAFHRAPRAWRGMFRSICMALAVLCSVAPGAVWAASDVMLVLDNSGSMRKNDPQFLLKPAVSAFVAGLEADTRAGLLIFDEDVDYAVPLADLDAAAGGRRRRRRCYRLSRAVHQQPGGRRARDLRTEAERP
ncbi:MAG: VWA domain-containing protein [Steroidobacteraceae bacterium]